MGVDYNAVGGIGVEFNDDLQYKAIELEYFTEEEWDEDPTGCVESLNIPYESAGGWRLRRHRLLVFYCRGEQSKRS